MTIALASKLVEATDIGRVVFYKEVREEGKPDSPIYPAMLFRIWRGEGEYAGLYVFKDTGVHKLGKVFLGEVEGCFNWIPDAFTEGKE